MLIKGLKVLTFGEFFVVAWIYKVQLASLGFIGVMPINLHLSDD